MILLLDHYDSFSYNLASLVREVTSEIVEVHRPDKITLADTEFFSAYVLSPGPGLPEKDGLTEQLVRQQHGKKPIFGVCLGLQTIATAFGGKLLNLPDVLHGLKTPILQTGESTIFKDFPTHFQAGRYHSWVVDKKQIPASFRITSQDEGGQVMSLEHQSAPTAGVQFHPESVMTELGGQMLANFFNATLKNTKNETYS